MDFLNRASVDFLVPHFENWKITRHFNMLAMINGENEKFAKKDQDCHSILVPCLERIFPS